jgi:sortase A
MHTVRRIIAATGRIFISSGLLVLLFAVYELWGTSLAEARDQRQLQTELLKKGVGAVKGLPTTVPSLPVPTTAYVSPPPPPAGDAVAMLKIDKLGLVKAVVEGVDVNDLKKGPGHYDGTPMPGEAGNVAIAGHRTTYGAPFYRINELEPGDPIVITTKQGEFTYEVSEQKVVGPNDDYVLGPTPDNRLTLTTCHPRFSAAQRLIVTAKLVGQPVGESTNTTGARPGLAGNGGAGATTAPSNAARGASSPAGSSGAQPAAGSARATVGAGATGGAGGSAVNIGNPKRTAIGGGVSGASGDQGPAIAWGAASAAVALGTWLLSRRWRKWPSYLLGGAAFLVVLFVFFENFAALLPANV